MAEKIATTRSIARVAPDVLVVEAVVVQPPPAEPPALGWRAGQFLSLRIGDQRRSYSISNLPGGPVELLVKLLPDGVGSELFRGLRAGDALHFTGPMGFFTCDLAHAGDAVFCATGTGIAAALPMMEETLARPGETGRVVFYWGMREERDLYWLDRLERLAGPRFSSTICLSRASDGWTGVRGRIVAPVLAALPELDRPVFYVVGNGDMVRDLKQGLLAAGVDRKRQIRTEVFYPESKPAG